MTGQLYAHDPSTVILDNGSYYYFATGDLIGVRSSTNLTSWTGEPTAFDAVPSWIPNAVPGYSGQSLWAPDVIKLGSQYYLYYSASIWGTKLSAIGLATSPTLDPDAPNYGWTDQGMVIGSNHGSPYNAIDPSLMLDDATGKLWMTWGSFNNGIYVTELNPTNGKPYNSSPGVNVAAPGPTPQIEGAAMLEHDGMYYMFVNWGGCCSGVDSTYNIRFGRSASPTGPFLDRDGVNMLNNGGTLFLDDDGRKIGPGHFSFTDVGGQDMFSYHYYDADQPWFNGMTGDPTFELRQLHWTNDNWPSLVAVNPNWTGAGGSGWDQAASWTNAAVPNGEGHVANFASQTSGQYSVTLPGGRTVGTVNFRGAGAYTIGEASGPALTLSDVAGQTATLNVAQGSHAIAAPITSADNLEVNVTPTASVLALSGQLTAPKLSKYGDGVLTITGADSVVSGNLFVKKGRLSVTGSLTANSYTSVGQILGETASMSVSGSGSFTSNGDFNIGDTGDASTPATGTLYVSDQASIVVGTGGGFFVGSGYSSNTRAEGEVFQTGGTLTVNRPANGSFIVGGRGSSNATGVYNLSGGTVNANTSIRIGGGGTGTLNVSGDGELNTTSTLHLGFASSGQGTVNLDGGTLTAPSISKGAGNGTFNFNGGVLRAGASTSALLQNLTAANVKARGAVIDTQSHSVTLAQPLVHAAELGVTIDGGLTKRGAGVLTLTGANTYTGDTHIQAGTLSVTGSGSIANSANIHVLPGATLDVSGLPGAFQLANGQTLNNSSSFTVLGDVIATGGSTVTGDGVFTGDVTLQGGSALVIGGASVSRTTSLSITNGDFETGINPPGDADVDQWFDVNTFAGGATFWTAAQHEQGLSPTPDAGVLLGDGNNSIGGPIGAGGRWIYQPIGAKATGSSYTISFDYGGDNNSIANRAVGIRVEVFQGAHPGAADDNDIADEGLALITSLDSPTTSLFGEGNFASFSSELNLSAANSTDPLWLRLSNLPGAGTDPGSWVVLDNVAIEETFAEQSFLSMSIQGDLDLHAGSMAIFDIAASGVNDLVNVTGVLSVDSGAAIRVNLDADIDAADLRHGDSWALFDFGLGAASFDTLLLPTGLASGLEWKTDRLASDGLLSVGLIAGNPGDLNNDGVVDAADYTVWRDNVGSSDESLINHAGETDGTIDLQDYLVWRINYGVTYPSVLDVSIAAPEPAAAVLLLVASAALTSLTSSGRRCKGT